MKRVTLNFLIDLVSLLVMLGLAATGLIVRYVLPAGSGGGGRGAGRTLWGLGRHDWGDVHWWLALAGVGLLVVHVALHWTWVCALVRRWVWSANGGPVGRAAARRRLFAGVGLLAVAVAGLAGFVWYAQGSVQTGPGRDRPAARAFRGASASGARPARQGRGFQGGLRPAGETTADIASRLPPDQPSRGDEEEPLRRQRRRAGRRGERA